MIACDWTEPGHDRYTGGVAAAIAAYHLPLATQAELVRAWEAREFTDTVVIDRDSIRGKAYEYRPDIRSMHFGSRGRVCATVDRSRWDAVHTESAVVLCADAECIGIPAVCGNVFRIARGDPLAGPERAGFAGLPRPLGSGEAFALEGLSIEPTGAGYPQDLSEGPQGYATARAYSVGYVGVGRGYYSPGEPLAPVTLIPEPSTWGLLLLGLAAVAWRSRA